MLLTIEDQDIQNPSAADVETALASMDGEKVTFVILDREGEPLSFVQAAGSPEEGFLIEYRESDQMYRSVKQDMPLSSVVRAFQQYYKNDAFWNQGIAFEPFELEGPKKSGCLGLIVLLITGGLISM